MVRITFRCPGGGDHVVDLQEGDSLMTGGLFAGVPGIEGLCGGVMACGTCHVHVDDGWRARSGMPGPSESEMLESLENSNAASRLGCQLIATAELDGMIVIVAAR